MFMLHGRLGAKPGKQDQLLEILTENEQSDPMPGCRLYVVAMDETDPDGIWVTEIWESETAHKGSLQLDAVKDRIARAMPFIDTAGIRQQRLDALTGIPD